MPEVFICVGEGLDDIPMNGEEEGGGREGMSEVAGRRNRKTIQTKKGKVPGPLRSSRRPHLGTPGTREGGGGQSGGGLGCDWLVLLDLGQP